MRHHSIFSVWMRIQRMLLCKKWDHKRKCRTERWGWCLLPMMMMMMMMHNTSKISLTTKSWIETCWKTRASTTDGESVKICANSQHCCTAYESIEFIKLHVSTSEHHHHYHHHQQQQHQQSNHKGTNKAIEFANTVKTEEAPTGTRRKRQTPI